MRAMVRAVIAALSSLTLACSSGPAHSPDQGTSTAAETAPTATVAAPSATTAPAELDLATSPAGATCEQTVAAIQKRWSKLEPGTLRLEVADDQHESMLEVSSGGEVPNGFGLFVAHGELRMANEHRGTAPASGAGAYVAQLNRVRTNMPNLQKPWPALVAIPASAADVRHVVTALESLGAASVPTFVIAKKTGAAMLPTPGPFLPSADPVLTLTELRDASKRCASLANMLEVLQPGADPKRVATKVTDIVPRGLNDCACAADAPTLYRVWTHLLFRGVAVVGKPVKTGSAPDASLVSADGLDGAAFYEALPSDGRAIRFR